MTYRVTQQDIDAGLRGSPRWCPVARSIRRRHHVADVVIRSNTAQIGQAEYELPERVKDWIRQFDIENDVRPFRFEL